MTLGCYGQGLGADAEVVALPHCLKLFDAESLDTVAKSWNIRFCEELFGLIRCGLISDFPSALQSKSH